MTDTALKRSQISSIETETCLLPSIVAESVIEELGSWIRANRAHVDARLPGVEDKEGFIASFLSHLDQNKDALVSGLAAHAEGVYAANGAFAEGIRASSGRETLYAFMRHWLGGRLAKDPATAAILAAMPDGFLRGRPARG